MKPNRETGTYSLFNLAYVLNEYDGFDVEECVRMLGKPPVKPYGTKFKSLKPLRFFQRLAGDYGYRPEHFEVDGVTIDFYYYWNKTVGSIVVRGEKREEGLYKEGNHLGRVAREIADGSHIPFCHTYKFDDGGYGPYKIKLRDYAFMTRAGSMREGISALKGRIGAVRDADKALDEIVAEEKRT